MTITKQRVGKIIYRHEMGLNSDVTAEEVYDLAVLALNLSNIANLKRYELDMDGCDSFGQDCGADMTEDLMAIMSCLMTWLSCLSLIQPLRS